MQTLFQDIETERKRKIESLFQDKREYEKDLLYRETDKAGLSVDQKAAIDRALRFALNQDYGPRDLDRYYVTHPIRVARFMTHILHHLFSTEESASEQKTAIIIAALIHNAIEKEILTPTQITNDYGKWVADAIVTITVDRPAMATEAGRKAYYTQLASAPASVQCLKIFDKLDNLFILCINPNAQIREEYLREIEVYLVPLAQKAMNQFTPYLQELIAHNRTIGYQP